MLAWLSTFAQLRAYPAGALGETMIRFALSQEQIDIVERLVASGRYEAPQSVLEAALVLLETRERQRIDCLTALHDALASEEKGEAGADEDDAPQEKNAAGKMNGDDVPALEADICDDGDGLPFDDAALDEIERLIASRAAVAVA